MQDELKCGLFDTCADGSRHLHVEGVMLKQAHLWPFMLKSVTHTRGISHSCLCLTCAVLIVLGDGNLLK